MSRIRPRLAWELPLAVPSYLLFTGSRALFYRLVRFPKGRPRRWNVQDAAAIERLLPVLMLVGPRWNTHAVIVYPSSMFRVERRITIGCPDPARVTWWSAVVRDDRRRALHHIGTTGLAPGQQTVELELPPGLYNVAFRYYAFGPGATTPALDIDGEPVLSPTALPPQASVDAYEVVRDRAGLFYRALASHVDTVLRLRDWLPTDFVHRIFLPVGDPTNTFVFDVVERGERLRIEVPPDWLERYRVVFTTYNRASFPVQWSRVEAPSVETAPMTTDGFWLVRAHPLAAGTPPARGEDIRVVRMPER